MTERDAVSPSYQGVVINLPTTWHIEETRRHVHRLFGREQLNLANPSLHSAVERQSFVSIHYHDVRRILDEFVDSKLKKSSLFEVIFASDEDTQDTFQVFIFKVSAYVTACIQSLHAINDILSHAIYFSLGLNTLPNPLAEHKIDARTVLKRLGEVDAFTSIHDVFNELCNGGESAHLNALSNHGKHRSVIRASLNEDQSGLSVDKYYIKFPGFRYRGRDYPEVEVAAFLSAEYARSSRCIVEVGIELNRILTTR